MISFQTPQPADKPWVDALLRQSDYRACEYSFTNLLAWRDAYDQRIAQVDDCLVVRVCGPQGFCYLYPAGGGGFAPVIAQLEQDAHQRQEPFRMACLTQQQTEQLEEQFPGQFAFTADRDGFDYLYDIDRLADLPGKKLHAKRNHINRFVEQFPQWVYEPITADNLAECLEMDKEWYRRSLLRTDGQGDGGDLGAEGKALRIAMEHFAALQLEGGLIRVYGEVVAFAMGDVLCADTFDIHFEKAYGEMQGAYAIINREFARHIRAQHPSVRYLNREDDMGVEGLRKAKQSYYPDQLVEKYLAQRH